MPDFHLTTKHLSFNYFNSSYYFNYFIYFAKSSLSLFRSFWCAPIWLVFFSFS